MQPRIPNQFYNRPSLPLGETGACEKESQRTAQVRSNLTESAILPCVQWILHRRCSHNDFPY